MAEGVRLRVGVVIRRGTWYALQDDMSPRSGVRVRVRDRVRVR